MLKKILISTLVVPVVFFSGCTLFGPDPLQYHNDIVAVENELDATANQMESITEQQAVSIITNGFDQAAYDEAFAPVIQKIDDSIARVNEIGAFDGDDSVQKEFLEALEILKTAVNTDTAEFLKAMAENSTDPEKVNAAMENFMIKMEAIEVSANEFEAALKVFDEKHGIEVAQ